MTASNNKIYSKISALETQTNKQEVDIAVIKEHCKNFNKFLTNDFPHFEDEIRKSITNLSNKIDTMKSQVSYGLVIGIVSVIILQIILRFFK